MKTLRLKIVSPEHVIYQGKATQVALPGASGAFMILPEHAPLISSLVAGIVRYRTEVGEGELPIMSGFVEVNRDEVSVCVE